MSEVSKPHSESQLIVDTASFLVTNPEEAKVSDALKLAQAYLGLFEQLEIALEALREIRNATEAAGYGEMSVRWVAERARRGLGEASSPASRSEP